MSQTKGTILEHDPKIVDQKTLTKVQTDQIITEFLLYSDQGIRSAKKSKLLTEILKSQGDGKNNGPTSSLICKEQFEQLMRNVKPEKHNGPPRAPLNYFSSSAAKD